MLVLGAVMLAGACTVQVNPPSPSPTTSTTPPAGVALTGQSAAGHSFGSFVGEVEPALRSALGDPADVTENTGCPVNPKWTRTIRWQGLAFVFESDTEARTDQTEFTHWQLRPGDGVPSGVTLVDDLSPTASFAELTDADPGTAVTQQLGWSVLELPNGISYLGENQRTPSVIHGGPVPWCE